MSKRKGHADSKTPEEPNLHEFGGGGGEDTANCVDRISNLPLEIIRQIHFCLPLKDIAKTSVLSQKWRSIWISHPEIHFNESHFGFDRDKLRRDAFLTHLEKHLDDREKCEYDCSVHTLFLRMTVENSFAELLVEKWIDFALINNAKWLYLSFIPTYPHRFNLHKISFSATKLVGLIIFDCEITNCSFMLPNLKSLFLSDVIIEDDDLKDLITGCPQIEELRIVDPKKLRSIVISNPALKFFGVHLPWFDSKIVIESAILESLEFSSRCVGMCEIEITSPATVRNLTLRNVYNDWEKTWMNFINRFPLLEKLVIDGCSNLRNLYVSHQNLRSFVVKVYDGVKAIRIDAPKFKSIEFTGGLTCFTGVKDSGELKFIKFHLKPQKLDAQWYTWLRDLLKSFAHIKHLSLICQNEQAVVFPDELNEILHPTINDLETLELRIDSSTATSQQIIDGFTWILPGLKTLSLTLGSISKLIEFPERR